VIAFAAPSPGARLAADSAGERQITLQTATPAGAQELGI
jgi:hypothetical protein